MLRLSQAIAERTYRQSNLRAQLEEAAVSRAIAAAIGGKTPPPWPTWEQVRDRIEVPSQSTHPVMGKFKDQALSE